MLATLTYRINGIVKIHERTAKRAERFWKTAKQFTWERGWNKGRNIGNGPFSP